MNTSRLYLSIKGLLILVVFAVNIQCIQAQSLVDVMVDFEQERMHHKVSEYWNQKPITLTDTFCVRSSGTTHDFYSEGDYWWQNPTDLNGPYIRKDGLSNPNNFLNHRLAMVRMSRIVGAMTSQYLLTGDEKYAQKAMEHLRAWFITDSTKMNPNMLYAQAIQGLYTGRGIGLIDGLHLIEVARSIYMLQNSISISTSETEILKTWFADFLRWMTTYEYGKTEMVHPNNHGTCWAMQAAAYAQLTSNDSILNYCNKRFREVLIPAQMAVNGSFPLELERTKPYGYSLFNLDAMTLLTQILYTSGYTDSWKYETTDGKSMHKAIEFLYPYIANKSEWPYSPDVLYWDNWPVSQPSLVLCGIAFNNKNYLDLWKSLEHDPEVVEVQRNLVMRYPLLWIDFKRNSF